MTRSPAFEPALMTELNTTPLIDVLLVLLVMLIITIPLQTHAMKLDLPQTPHVPPPLTTVNLIEITASDAVLWNGQSISRQGLADNLAQTQQMQPAPELHLRPNAKARYAAVADVLGIIKREHVSKFGFVGNESYLNW